MSSASRLFAYLFVGALVLNTYRASGQIIFQEINETIIGVGNFELDLNGDSSGDFNLEIITLPNEALAARVQALNGSLVLDNSGFGYPDALEFGEPVAGAFAPGNGVLGTFNNAGQFNGQGLKYMGFRLADGDELYDGWLLLYLSQGNDTLQIVRGAYHTSPGMPILAGEGDVSRTSNVTQRAIRLFPNPASSYVKLAGVDGLAARYTLHNLLGEVVLSGDATERVELANYPAGVYFVTVSWAHGASSQKLVINH